MYYRKRLSLLFLLLLLFTMESSGTDISAKYRNASLHNLVTGFDSIPSAEGFQIDQIFNAATIENRDLTYMDERFFTSDSLSTFFYNPITSKNLEDWEQRKEFLRERVLVSAGLWPLPDKTPLNPVYYHSVEHSDYTVKTLSIETFPGFLLVGNLYLPKGEGKFPILLSTHGHFPYGRLNDDEVTSVPARSINFAKRGYIVFSYDMVGYNDTKQVSHSFAIDKISKLYGINLLGLQLWNSIRSLDFLYDLPNADTSRVGITGASGGGSQAFLLTAVDDRIDVSAPVNMVSITMQGGDLCEGSPGLRVNTNNAEIAAMFAPKPLILVSNSMDWTFNTRNSIYPPIRSIYKLYDAEDKLQNNHFDFPHNYNKASREVVYQWFDKWLLGKDLKEDPELDFKMDEDKELLAFLKERTDDTSSAFKDLPKSVLQKEVPSDLDEEELRKQLIEMYREQLAAYWPAEEGQIENFKEIYHTAAAHIVSAAVPEDVEAHIIDKETYSDFEVSHLVVSESNKNEWIPSTLFKPIRNQNGRTIILTSERGVKDWVGEGMPKKEVNELLQKGFNVLIPELFKQGEHTLLNSDLVRRREHFYTFDVYNLTDAQERSQDLMTITKFLEDTDLLNSEGGVYLWATGSTGKEAILISPLTKIIRGIILDENQLDPASDEDMLQFDVPSFLRIGGMKTFLGLSILNTTKLLTYNHFEGSSISKELNDLDQLKGGKQVFNSSDKKELTGLDVLNFISE